MSFKVEIIMFEMENRVWSFLDWWKPLRLTDEGLEDL